MKKLCLVALVLLLMSSMAYAVPPYYVSTTGNITGTGLNLKYNTGNYVPFTVNSFGSLTVAPVGLTGNINLTPALGANLVLSRNITNTTGVLSTSGVNHPGTFNFITTGNAPVIADGSAVAFHIVTQTTASIKNLWALNPVLVKNAATPTGGWAWGFESTVANGTSEHNLATGEGPTGTLIGVVSSIIAGRGSAAFFSSSSASAGSYWDLGLSIDGIATDGSGIRLGQGASGTYGAGIDFSNVTSYTNGAALLGNAHSIAWKDTGLTARHLLLLDANNNFIVGGNAGGSQYITSVRAGGSGVTGTVHIQGADGTDWATFSNNGLTTVKGVTTDGIKIASWGGYSGNAYVCVSLVTGAFYSSGLPCP